MRAVGKADRCARARNLLHGHAMLEVAEPCPTVLLLNRDAMQAKRSHFRPKIAWENIVAVNGVRARRDTILRKITHGLAQHVDVGPEAKIKARPCIWNRSVPPLAHRNRCNWRPTL